RLRAGGGPARDRGGRGGPGGLRGDAPLPRSVSSRGDSGQKIVATNRKARHDYQIEERFEAGLVLSGSEVKSLRQGRASLTESYARVQDGEVWIENLHIPPSAPGEEGGYDRKRRRKLLTRRCEIDERTLRDAE